MSEVSQQYVFKPFFCETRNPIKKKITNIEMNLLICYLFAIVSFPCYH